jgi:hypothetical protein
MELPLINSYPYYEPQIYSPPGGANVAAGAKSPELIMNAVQLNSIPSRVYIFVA